MPVSKRPLTASIAALLVALIFLTAIASSAEKDPPLGSPDWQPSPVKPVGWRGDWTGRFPGATPPLAWSRRVKGITTELRYQANKPAGEPGKDARPLEYFTIKDWLVAGPFSLQDPAADLEKDFLGGEANVAPSDGDKAGDFTWKYLRADVDTQSRHEHNEGTCGQCYVDFIYTFGKITIDGDKINVSGEFVNKAAYAHTYIHSLAEARVRLQIPFTGDSGRFWLNGKPTKLEKNSKAYDVTLDKGWNRLLVKITTADGLGTNYDGRWLSKWLMAAYFTPIPPVSYETRNIKWMTKVTGRSMSQPIVVGSKIFIGSGISDLLCLDKASGKLLWIQSNTPYDAMTADERAALAIKDKVEPLIEKLTKLNEQFVAAINAAVSPQGLSSDQETELDKKVKEKSDTERSIHQAFAKLDRKKYPAMSDNEVSSSNSTPCSDGANVYWVCGGGMKGPGAYVIACFDLNGKRIWSVHAALGASEHGSHASPGLADGKLIYAVDKLLMAYDAKTGKELWRASSKDWQNQTCGSSALITKIGAEDVIVGKRYIYRAADGVEIGPHRAEFTMTESTPIVENGVLYNPFSFRGWHATVSFISVRLPASTAPGSKAETIWLPEGKDVSMALRGPIFAIASPLYYNGIVYSIEMSGGLAAVDVEGKKSLYRRSLDGYNRYNRFLYGVCASPTLAGNNIYITDDAGYTHIIQPGPEFREVGKNILENIHFSGVGGNPCHQESFYTSPYFEGKCLYLRGEDYLYCIEEK